MLRAGAAEPEDSRLQLLPSPILEWGLAQGLHVHSVSTNAGAAT
jgi:hypothetical protein